MSWMRAIDSAQRVITNQAPVQFSDPNVTRVDFHIQGVTIYTATRTWKETYPDMADIGIAQEGEKPLTLWQRLKRTEALVGHAHFEGDSVALTLWTPTRLTLMFDRNQDDQAILFRETEIMVLSAGFHFRVTGEPDYVSRVTAF